MQCRTKFHAAARSAHRHKNLCIVNALSPSQLVLAVVGGRGGEEVEEHLYIDSINCPLYHATSRLHHQRGNQLCSWNVPKIKKRTAMNAHLFAYIDTKRYVDIPPNRSE